MATLQSYGALDQFKSSLSYFLLEAANAEVQELSLRADLPVEYLASAIHKCGIFAQAVGVYDVAEVRHVSGDAWESKADPLSHLFLKAYTMWFIMN